MSRVAGPAKAMASKKTLLGGLLVVGAAIIMLAPGTNAINVGPIQLCASWAGAGVGRHSCAGDPAASLTTGSNYNQMGGCFGAEPVGDDTETAMLPGTLGLAFTVNLGGVDADVFDWAFASVGGVVTKIGNPDPFVCDGGNNIARAAGDTLASVVLGCHQDGFGDPLSCVYSGIST
jgi:hypothetical protein